MRNIKIEHRFYYFLLKTEDSLNQRHTCRLCLTVRRVFNVNIVLLQRFLTFLAAIQISFA